MNDTKKQINKTKKKKKNLPKKVVTKSPKVKAKPKKYYAIKIGKGVTDLIVRSWDECKSYTDGCNSIFKSFLTEKEATDYLNSVDVEDKAKQIKFAMNRNKELKETTTCLKKVRLPNELYQAFIKKCNEFGFDEEIVVENLIKEWVY